MAWAIAVLPVGDRRSSLRPNLVTVPIEGAPPSQVVLVSRKGDPNPMIRNLRLAAKAVLTAPGTLTGPADPLGAELHQAVLTLAVFVAHLDPRMSG
ncbi:hypothetical protein [Frankia gtarii]|uniref:hypothetical protein n=1 Tax=Frankia gtarii TaxID=2950102 RepID=UPI0021BE60EB|nr:hypothetical protein [Frankia gtarii]